MGNEVSLLKERKILSIESNKLLLQLADVVNTTAINKESITLIWFDKNINVNEDTKETARRLREINDYVVCHKQLEECVEYIKSIQNEKIFIVTSGAGALDILPFLQNCTQIDSIFIFCMRREKYEHLPDEYRKIVSVFTDREELIKSIKENIELVEKHLETFSFYDNNQKSTKDLSKEQASFLWFQLFKDIIIQMPKTIESKQEMIKTCKEYYHGNEVELDYIEKFDSTYKPEDAITWYTKQCFVYKMINKALRTEDIEQLYIFRFYIADLSSSLSQEKEKQNFDLIHLYRGTKLSLDELDMLRNNEGKLMSMNGFLSTSQSREQALIFATKFTKRTDLLQVLFDIEVEQNQSGSIFADIAKCSCYPYEEEVLFDIGSAFEILMVTYNERRNLWTVSLRATNQGTEAAKEWISMNRNEIKATSVAIMFGTLLAEMGEYNKSLKYFENLAQNPQEENLSLIYDNIGHGYRLKRDYDKALCNYQRAYDLSLNAQPSRVQDTMRISNNIGVVYYEMKEYKTALEHFEKALPVLEEHHKKNRQTAHTLNNIGLVYSEQGDYVRALEYLTKAHRMREAMHSKHPDTAASLSNIGMVYHYKRFFETALTFYVRALEMYTELLPQGHLNIKQTEENIKLTKGQLNKSST
ncbi:unnamed protein product [Didymodactylos carnosus]|uniref:ADP ribosyltransferase domain-containing protein n=1 Tax=Didymodactylos carnosus TaxID=1234261 RepID=A0A814VD97_9BILA|nr:unnamed protein product [Didymodactylos carnosus]CAF1187468.1 unnamed protein product [Didymodactylos carnosus]CAF3784743.1 unnamed protein product [Didymodactylos carnosus]CAF3951730.1 unnamed protein product [Didymodactylos carnosus]